MVYGHAGPQAHANYTSDGKLIGTRLIHICRDTEWGCVLRSRFLFGYDLPSLGMAAEQVRALVPDAMGPNLLQHCYDEFTMLSRILPALYAAEGMDRSKVIRPW